MTSIANKEEMQSTNQENKEGKIIKLLNKGTYGCIFKPGLTCNGMIDNSKKNITKIQKEKETSANEMYISEKIKEIANYTRYFAPINETCQIDVGTIDNAEMKKCDFIHENMQLNKSLEFEMNRIRYVGKDTLGSYLLTLLEKKTDADTFSKEFVNSYKILLEGIHKISEKGIVHYDIKENNIMCRDNTGRPIFIDFGLSFDASSVLSLETNDMFDVFYAYAPEYAPWSIELSILSYIINKIGKDMVSMKDISNLPASIELLDECIEEYFVKNRGMRMLCSTRSCEELQKKTKEYFSEMVKPTMLGTIKWKKVIEELIKYYKTWDVYALSMCYLQLYEELKIEDTLDVSFMNEFKNMLEETIQKMPNERPDAKTSLDILKKLQRVTKQDVAKLETVFMDFNKNDKNIKERREHFSNSKIKSLQEEKKLVSQV
jgi:serine/threonine protein kinase